jgi:hypothetical protein
MIIKSFTLFESDSNSKLFIELPERESNYSGKELITAKSSDIEIIIDILDKYNLTYTLDSSSFIFLISINGSRRKLFVLKDEDEYYYVVTNIDGNAWYKCDTIEGLKQCVEYLTKQVSRNNYPLSESKEIELLFKEVTSNSVRHINNMRIDDLRLSEKDDDIIESIFRKKGFPFKREMGVNHFLVKNKSIIIYNIGDEYYYIGTTIGRDSLISLTKWYKCDTIEGVKQCVNYLLSELSNEYKNPFRINENIVDLYHEISEIDYQNFIDDYSTGDFNESELVESIFNDNSIKYRRNNICIYDLYIKNNKNRQTQIIIDENNDEYYYVDVYDFTLSDKERFYKCDGKEGLRQCIEYIIGKTKINEAKFNKRGKTTQDHQRDIEDILLEFSDDDLFSVTVYPIISFSSSAKKRKETQDKTRSFEIRLSCNQEQIVKYNLFRMESVYSYENGGYERRPVPVTRLVKEHLEKYYDLVKARLEKYNYFTFSANRPTSLNVIYRQSKFKSS